MSGIADRADISQVLAQIRSVQSNLAPAQSTLSVNSAELNSRSEARTIPGFASIYSDTLSGDTARPGEDVRQLRAVEERSDFGGMFRSAIDSVNDAQAKASALQRAYELGEDDVDLTEVMIQMQKSTVSFEALTQVRNKVISAYQDVMNMPL